MEEVNMSLITFIFLALAFLLLIFTLKETLCNYRNKYPKFHNGDKRLSEILENTKNLENFKTRKIV